MRGQVSVYMLLLLAPCFVNEVKGLPKKLVVAVVAVPGVQGYCNIFHMVDCAACS